MLCTPPCLCLKSFCEVWKHMAQRWVDVRLLSGCCSLLIFSSRDVQEKRGSEKGKAGHGWSVWGPRGDRDAESRDWAVLGSYTLRLGESVFRWAGVTGSPNWQKKERASVPGVVERRERVYRWDLSESSFIRPLGRSKISEVRTTDTAEGNGCECSGQMVADSKQTAWRVLPWGSRWPEVRSYK